MANSDPNYKNFPTPSTTVRVWPPPDENAKVFQLSLPGIGDFLLDSAGNLHTS
jgi:hypothetical protein